MTVKPRSYKDQRHCDSVSCDGGNNSLGHPVVWYSFAKSDVVECNIATDSSTKTQTLICDNRLWHDGRPCNHRHLFRKPPPPRGRRDVKASQSG